MKNKTRTNRLLLASGLLLLVLPLLLRSNFSLTDYQRGLIVGIGIGLEVLALFRMQRARV